MVLVPCVHGKSFLSELKWYLQFDPVRNNVGRDNFMACMCKLYRTNIVLFLLKRTPTCTLNIFMMWRFQHIYLCIWLPAKLFLYSL